MKFSVFSANIFIGLLCSVFLSSCELTGESQRECEKREEAELLSTMTPEEREDYLALQRAKERFQRKKIEYSAEKPAEHRTAPKKSWFSFERHSEEKRKRMLDVSRPVILYEDEHVIPTKGNSGRRSETLLNDGRERTKVKSN